MPVRECPRCTLRFVATTSRPAPATCPRSLAPHPQPGRPVARRAASSTRSAANLRTTIVRAVADGKDLDQINEELIDPAALCDDHKAALWLLAFALLDPAPPAPPASQTYSPWRRRRL